MAHNLYQDRLAFTGETCWHGLGTQFSEAMTTEEAIEASGIGFRVTKEPLFWNHPTQGLQEIPDQFATLNNDTQEVLGVVGARYEPISVKEEFMTLGDALLGESGGRWTSAFATGKGERIFLQMAMPETFSVLQGDEVQTFLSLATSHDGTLANLALTTNVRTICQNTANMMLKGAKPTISIKHTKNQAGKLKMAVSILQEMAAYQKALGESFKQFADFKIDDAFVDEYLDALFRKPSDLPVGPQQTIAQRKRDEVIDCLVNGPGMEIPGVAGTAWAAFNAATDWADHKMTSRGEGDTANRILFGAPAKFKQLAYDSLCAMVL